MIDRGGVFGREGERLAWYEQRQRGKTAFEIYSVRIGLVLYGFIIEISYCIGLYRAYLVKISIQPGRYPDLYPSSVSSRRDTISVRDDP